MIERGIRQSLPLSIELSLLAERATYILAQNRKPTTNDEVILKKAQDFLERVLRGEEIVRTLRLGATSSSDIHTYCWGLKAYVELAERKRKFSEEDLREVINGFQSSIVKLREGKRETIDESALKELQDFFRIMLNITTSAGVQPVERVSVGYNQFE